jgi:antitoxin (DNA-binding transcriptional repressor) of toxin-antitoxin stability system
MGQLLKIEVPPALEPILREMRPGSVVTLTRDGEPVAEVRQLVGAAQASVDRARAWEELLRIKASLPPMPPEDPASIDRWRHGEGD